MAVEAAIESAKDSSHSAQSKLLSDASIALFIVVFSLISIGSLRQKSPTVDEPIHLLSGYASLKWGDYRANPEHPPLAKLWAALPLLALEIKDPRPSTLEWEIILDTGPHTTHTGSVAAKLFFVDNDADQLFFWAKVQIILLALLLGIFVYRWSKELFGFEAALASLFLYCLDPNILAHSQIVHTDIAFSALFFLARPGQAYLVQSRADGMLLRFGGYNEIRLSRHARRLGCAGHSQGLLRAAARICSRQSPRGFQPAREDSALGRNIFLFPCCCLCFHLGCLRISLQRATERR